MQRHIFDFRARPENRKLEFSRNLNLWDYKQSQENKSTITAPAVAVIFFPHIHILAARSAMRAALFYCDGLYGRFLQAILSLNNFEFSKTVFSRD